MVLPLPLLGPLAVLSAATTFDRLDQQIRDGALPKAAARGEFARLIKEIHKALEGGACPSTPRSAWVFPLEGYPSRAIGAGGYRPRGYDYFAGNRHGGHPSLDLFIRDRDQDELDDQTGAPVPVRSISAGVVVAANSAWEPASQLRGGKYVWIYDAVSRGLFYYAHLRIVRVRPGECVRPGTTLGEVGRSGLNAAKRRSPTHVHLTLLLVEDGQPSPRDLSPLLAGLGKPPTAYPWLRAYDPNQSLERRIPPPPGYVREPLAPSSFGAWLRGLPLRPGRPPVHLFDGSLKGNQSAHAAVFDVDVGRRDLQQCADAVIRLRAEYLYGARRLDAIRFHLTNGEDVPFARWRAGERPLVAGRSLRWTRSAQPDVSYSSLRRYLTLIFTYAGSYSLARELAPVGQASQLQIGDVFVQGGFPGHAVLVVDVAVQAKSGARAFLLAQSYMPAQEIHLLVAPEAPKLSPWYPLDELHQLVTPEWSFTGGDLRRFKD